MEKQSVYRTCTLCEATCGIQVTVEDGEATRIEGDRADPFSRGHICPKAHGMLDLQRDPDRLRRPIHRTATGWQEIAWDEAYELAAQQLNAFDTAIQPANPSVGFDHAVIVEYKRMLKAYIRDVASPS